MKDFIKTIKDKDLKLTKSLDKKELVDIEKTLNDLETQHQEIKDNLKDVNYLLDLIEKHKITEVSASKTNKKVAHRSSWLAKIKDNIEKIHVLHTNKLTPDDIAFLQKESSKLKFEKEQLAKEHHLIHQLIAKARIYLMNTRNAICEEITKGHDIAAVGEKLLEHFGKEIKEEMDYDFGRKKIMTSLEETFLINKIQAKKLFDILEKSNVLQYNMDTSNIIPISNYEDYSEYTNINYMPLFGTWHINA
jgi:hypothetical protein